MPPESENEMILPRRDSSGKLGGSSRRGGQEANSAPGSPMLGTASSFGSASSAPSLSNLPPIRVRPDDRGPDLRAAGTVFEEHFPHMNVSDPHQKQQQVDAEALSPDPPQLFNATALSTAAAAAANSTNISSTERPNPSRIFSSDGDRSDHGDVQRSSPQMPQQQRLEPPQQQQQQKPIFRDLPIPGDATSRPVYYQEMPPPFPDPNLEVPQYDQSFRMPVQMTEKRQGGAPACLRLPAQWQPLLPHSRSVDAIIDHVQFEFNKCQEDLTHQPANRSIVRGRYQSGRVCPVGELKIRYMVTESNVVLCIGTREKCK